jgi:predicted amidohydrolase YtcJ
VGEALLLFTRDAAYLSFDEKERGTLEARKRADYVLLSENPLVVRRNNSSEFTSNH